MRQQVLRYILECTVQPVALSTFHWLSHNHIRL